RSVELLVALLLLTSAVTASAEYASVLWRETAAVGYASTWTRWEGCGESRSSDGTVSSARSQAGVGPEKAGYSVDRTRSRSNSATTGPSASPPLSSISKRWSSELIFASAN